jgi:hypothetical protein
MPWNKRSMFQGKKKGKSIHSNQKRQKLDELKVNYPLFNLQVQIRNILNRTRFVVYNFRNYQFVFMV